MKLSLDRTKVRVYLWIASAYLFLWIFAELVSNPGTIFQRIWNQFWLNTFILFFNFILFEYSFPFILKSWKRYFTAPFILWFHLMINTFGLYMWRMIGIKLNLYFELVKFENIYIGVQNVAGIGIFSLIFYGLAVHIYNFRKLKQSTIQLTIEKQIAELNFLKSQTNPHFLFNTLNNIYSLARDKSDQAPEAILKLSKMLRFILYEASGKKFITLEQELKLIDDYVQLEKLRYDDSLKFNFNYYADDLNTLIPPLLLIPLIENAFKHGTSETLDNPFISISLNVQNNILEFTVENSILANISPQSMNERIGISNLKRQLELLYKNYDLNFSPGEKLFKTTLKINLTSNV